MSTQVRSRHCSNPHARPRSGGVAAGDCCSAVGPEGPSAGVIPRMARPCIAPEMFTKVMPMQTALLFLTLLWVSVVSSNGAPLATTATDEAEAEGADGELLADFPEAFVDSEAKRCHQIEPPEVIVNESPTKAAGKCYQIAAARLRVLDRKSALYRAGGHIYYVAFRRGAPVVNLWAVVRRIGSAKMAGEGLIAKVEVLAMRPHASGEPDEEELKPDVTDYGFSLKDREQLGRMCPGGVLTVSELAVLSPYEFESKCVLFGGRRLKAINAKRALYKVGHTQAGEELVFDVSFRVGEPVAAFSTSAVILGKGVTTYGNDIVPKVDLIMLPSQQSTAESE
jgi:hypothetical protein